MLLKVAVREDAVRAVVNVFLTINTAVVSKLLVDELVSNGAVVTVIVIIVDGVSCVVIVIVVSLGNLLIVTSEGAIDISAVLVLVTMVTGRIEAELVRIEDNSDYGSSMER